MALPNAVSGGSQTTIPSGAIFVLHAPAATVSGWQDYFMTAANFLKSVTNDITSIQANITTIQGDIADLQDLGVLDKTMVGINSNTDKSIDGNSMIEWIGMRVTSGNPTIKIGTNNPDYDNLLPSASYSTGAHDPIRFDHYTGYGGSETQRFSVSGGTVNFSIKIIKNVY